MPETRKLLRLVAPWLLVIVLGGCPPGNNEVCNSGVDDDGDGLIDCADADCAQDPICQNNNEICDNNADDDGDGQVDCADADCTNDAACLIEDCDNGLDDDNDGQVDCADDDCNAEANCQEAGNCADGIDNDVDGLTDCDDAADCGADPVCQPGASCDLPIIAADPSSQSGDTAGNANISDGSCQLVFADGGDGADVIFEVTPVNSGVLNLVLSSATDQGVFVQTACGDDTTEIGCADALVGGNDEILDIEVTAGVPVFVFAGAFNPDEEGPFTLTIASSPFEFDCVDGVDNDNDGDTDCDDIDCVDDVACIPPEIDCNDLIDQDGDGLFDCEDPTDCVNGGFCVPGNTPTGGACLTQNDCQANNNDPFCIDEVQFGFPSGSCSEFCDLANNDCAGDGVCINIGLPSGNGICFDGCAVAADCQSAGYDCVDVIGDGTLACVPACDDDAQCPGTGRCDVASGTCVQPEICDNGIDEEGDGLIDCEDDECFADAGCIADVAAICAAAVVGVDGDNLGDTSLSASATFGTAGSCSGFQGGLEDVFSFTPGVAGQTGVLTLTLSSATDQGVYVRSTCEDATSELGCADALVGGNDEILVLNVIGGEALSIFASAFVAGEEGPYTLNILFAPDVCGDGIATGFEQCDDGNVVAGDGCSDLCEIEVTEIEPNDDNVQATANGVIDPIVAAISPSGDQDFFIFDVAGLNGGTATVTAELIDLEDVFGVDIGAGLCQDNSIDSEIEILDIDGVTSLATDEDGGDGFCSLAEVVIAVEGTYFVRAASSSIFDPAGQFGYGVVVTVTPDICGDGALTGLEECDDGNNVDGDGCDANCFLEIAEVEPNDDFANATAFVDPFFAAIDPAGDIDFVSFTAVGVSNTVIIETSDPTGLGSCVGIDTVMDFFDVDGVTILASDDDGGVGLCSLVVVENLPAGTYFASFIDFNNDDTFQYQVNATVFEEICGDGILSTPEECDDGNNVDGDGCDANCVIEVICGDGVLAGAEECDDGNVVNGDGCSDVCTLEALSSFTSAQDINAVNTGAATFSVFGENTGASGNRVAFVFTSDQGDICPRIVAAGGALAFLVNEVFNGLVPGTNVVTFYQDLDDTPFANGGVFVGDGGPAVGGVRVVDSGFTFVDGGGNFITDTTFGGNADGTLTVTTIDAITLVGSYSGFQQTEFITDPQGANPINVALDGTFTATHCQAITDSIVVDF